ncbi:hypothetical protein [Maribacter algarum]|nr:hypothetical protein [Maribacter algarum]
MIGVNAVMMFFSLSGTNQKAKKPSNGISKTSISEINPIDLISSKYKKAV